jgi:predicted nucleic acid-binding protein
LIVAQRTVFLDTSFVIALENKDDPCHARAKALDGELLRQDAILLFHWGILIETADGFARLARRAKGLQLLAKLTGESGYEILPITETLLQEGLSLYRSRTDKEWGLTDCISFSLMKERGITEALSADIHFRQAGFKALLLEPGED